jgi:hypothetical protein
VIVTTYQSLPYLLDALNNQIDPWYHLYVQDIEQTSGVQLTDFAEASWQGYTPLEADTFTPAVWADPFAVAHADQLQWLSPGSEQPLSVHGYFVTDGENGPLLWFEAVPDGPIDVRNVGTPVNIFPAMVLGPCANLPPVITGAITPKEWVKKPKPPGAIVGS